MRVRGGEISFYKPRSPNAGEGKMRDERFLNLLMYVGKNAYALYVIYIGGEGEGFPKTGLISHFLRHNAGRERVVG